MKRRQFIQSTVALSTLATAGTRAFAGEADGEQARIKRYQTLGKTDLKISDISFGAGKLPSAAMVLRAIDRGVNYFDTAPDYGRSEDYLGQALKRVKQRDKVYIASKFCASGPYVSGKSHLQLGSTKADYVAAVEESLKRLNTDYLDVVFVHAMGEKGDLELERKRLLDEKMLEAYEQLRQQGKVRYLAVSSHGPHNMESLLSTAVKSGHYDIIMPAFNFMKFPRVPEVLKEASAHGVGVIAMKTLAGAKEMDFDPKGSPFEQAAFKWVLNHPEVAGLVVTIKRVRDLDHYLPASGQTFAQADQHTLDRYAAAFGREYCRTGCGDCEAACSQGLPIATILRYQMYFETYEEEKRAMAQYGSLERNASLCGDCKDAACARACPYGISVTERLQAAHRDLSPFV